MAEAAYEGELALAAQSSGLDDAQAALDATNASINNVSSSMTAQAAIVEGNAASMQNLVLSSSTVSTAMNAVGGDINDFATDLSNAGVSVETFRSLSDEQLTQLVASWDGTSDSIVASLDGMGVEMGDAGLSAATALANGMQSGAVDVDAATGILESAAAGDWESVSSQMGSAGISLPQSVADGITSNSFAASGATNAMLSMIALQLTGGDVKAAAQLLGHDIDAGLAQGIANGTLSEEQAALLGQEVIDNAKSTLQSHSPSLAMAQVGADVDAGLAQGISGGASGPLSAIEALGQQLIDGIDGVPGQAQGVGGRASAGFAAGISSGEGATRSSAERLSGAASEMGSGESRTWGSHLASNFADGISSGVSWVSNAARSIAQAAKNAIGFSVPKEGPWSGSERGGETSGLHLAQNFARGMLSGVPEVSSAARSLMGSAELSRSASYMPGRAASRAAGQSRDEVSMLLMQLVEEVSALRQELGPTIANYSPAFPSERQAKRKVQDWTR